LKKIVIIGARFDGHAKVVLEIIQSERKYEVAGFVDDNLFGKNIKIRDLSIIGRMNDLEKLKSQLGLYGAIVAIGNNSQRRFLAEKVQKTGLELINAIHPTVHIDTGVTIGKGNVFCQGVIIVTGTKIGNCVNIHTGATVDHDNVIDDGANLGPGVHTAGRVTICKDAFLGTATAVIPDGIIGEGAVTGAGTVVIRPVEPYTKVVGVPAKMIEKLIKP
jgi:sugar O-acyltransferase (sialic acid O-acetyltransferase NeuD family)